MTLSLTSGLFQLYRKPNDEPLYINAKSNHPPTFIKQIPAAINRRLSALSSDKETFDKALRSSGFKVNLHYYKKNTTTPTKRNRKRNVVWFNSPYSKNVQTNVAKTFLNLIKKHFPPNHKLHPVFNKNNVKVSYNCMPDMGRIINNHNKKILTNNNTTPQNGRNLEKKERKRPMPARQQLPHYQCNIQSELDHRQRRLGKELYRTNRRNIQTTIYAT